MSRRGHYPGGSTGVGPGNASWFTRDSVSAPKDDGKPDREPTAPTISLAAENQPQSELIKRVIPELRNDGVNDSAKLNCAEFSQ
jgi:hypothetical protein